MKTQNITPSFTGNYTIPSKGNNEKVFLMHNKVLDLVKKNKLSAVFKKDSIEISSIKSKDEIVKKSLKDYGIEFIEMITGKNN